MTNIKSKVTRYLAEQFIPTLNASALMFFIGAALVCVGNINGCTAFIAKQAEQDIKTSTTEPLAKFRADNQHANQVLARARLDRGENYE